jgi:MFS family permease
MSLETDNDSVIGILTKTREDPTSKKPGQGWRFYGTFACLALLNLVCTIDATILAVALPVRLSYTTLEALLTNFVETIATDLNATAIQAFWCGTSFLLCSTVFRMCWKRTQFLFQIVSWNFQGDNASSQSILHQAIANSPSLEPTFASFSHIIGRKSVILAALFLFTTGTIIASIAKKIGILLVGRCFQGVGGGGLVGLTYVLLADLVGLRERGKWMSIISLQWAIGSVIGMDSLLPSLCKYLYKST